MFRKQTFLPSKVVKSQIGWTVKALKASAKFDYNQFNKNVKLVNFKDSRKLTNRLRLK